eukprot:3208728-Rhodomonas_salina.4
MLSQYRASYRKGAARSYAMSANAISVPLSAQERCSIRCYFSTAQRSTVCYFSAVHRIASAQEDSTGASERESKGRQTRER